ncbi:N-myc-interactor-like [Conger conger]|uniref:N-myc-interactor-like n=1 Tax=Conger conger TaxID=82655 RepID=UPI002A5AA5D4|nr:N-myc-interactor-like [Conger conger]
MMSTEDVLSLKEPEEQNLTKAAEELVMWKNKVDNADTEKSRLLLDKLSAEDTKKQAQKETLELLEEQKKKEAMFNKRSKEQKDSILLLETNNQALMEQLKKYEDMLKIKKAEYSSLLQKSKVIADIPETKVRFTGVETGEDRDYDNIVGVFTITQRPSFQLTGGQALITFEEEEVAEKILKLPKCSVAFEKHRMDLKPHCVQLDPSVKFEVHMNVSKKKIRFSNLQPYLPVECMSHHLEMSFSKPSQGGGEVEEVAYNMDTNDGQISFLNTGVAESLALKRKHIVDVSHEVHVHPYFKYQLKKFQTNCGVPKRTVLIGGIQDVLDEEDLQDHLEIHFQKPCNNGGEVESIKYISRPNTADAHFSEDTA